MRDSIATAQKVSLQLKIDSARKQMGAAAATAAAAAAIPLPLASAGALIPIVIGMLTSISRTFGLKPSTTTLHRVVATVLGAPGATVTVQIAVGNALKFIPGAGSVVGGAINAASAATITTAIGELYIQALKVVMQRKPGQAPDFEAVATEFGTQVRQTTGGRWWRKWPWAWK